MTTLEDVRVLLPTGASPSVRAPAVAPKADWRQGAEGISVCAAIFILLWAMVREGGREPFTMAWAIPLTLPAVVLARPWRRLPRWAFVVALSVPAGALLICFVDQLGFTFVKDLGVWPYGAELFLLSAGFGRSADRRKLLAVAVCLLGIYEFVQALVPWPAWNNNVHPMLGTFYSSNQYGAFAAGIAVFGAALVLSRDSLLRWLGAVTAVTGGVGCALSHSAASTALLLAGAAFLMVASLVAGGRRFVRVAALSSIAALVYGAAAGLRALVAGPPVGATASWMPTSYGTAKLSQSKFDDLRARFHYWNVAWHDFLASPWTGHGHGWFGYHFGQTMHPGEFFSRWAHSGILQALADGGLLFGLPVALASAALLALAARRLLRSRRLIDTDPIMLAAAVAAVVFVVHAQFDFDWNYPVLAGVLGLVGGFMISPHRPGSSARS